jgi:uncharacterized membrane protein
MASGWKSALDRWVSAGLIHPALASRIREFEAASEAPQKLRWPIILAVAFGGILLGAGVLLFVAAHWDDLSPASRFALVLSLVAAFHVGGALLAEKFRALSSVLHAVGTIALGAGIFLAGQIFNLEEHWPGGVMLWALGACLGWLILREWPQAALAALLVPFWLAGEWNVATESFRDSDIVLAEGLLLLAITYSTAESGPPSTPIRRTFKWIGAVALLPLGCILPSLANRTYWGGFETLLIPTSVAVVGWLMALLIPTALAYLLKGRSAWMNLAAGLWVILYGEISRGIYNPEGILAFLWDSLGVYIWASVGCVGLIYWGLVETRKERINLGVAGLAITVLTFYFSSVLDKLGRSMALMSAGLVLLLGGWFLEKARRGLVARVELKSK